MHFFPGLYQPKRAKKLTSFSNPLAGAFYSNKNFLQNCKVVPRSISNLDHLSQLKYAVDNDQQIINQKIIKNKKLHLNKSQRKRIQRQIVAVHATSRMAQPTIKNGNKSLILAKRCIKALDNDTLNQLSKINLSKTFTFNHSIQQKLTQTTNSSNFQSQINQQNHNNLSSFHDIQILLLDSLYSYEDFKTKALRINLQKYFRSFFKKQLSGHFNQQFLNKVQFYIQKLLLKNKLDQDIDPQQYPIQLFTIATRMSFMNKINQLQSKKTSANMQNIQAMMKYYCIPSKQFRESCLRDILLMLSLQIYEKFNCSRHQEYVLLNQQGKQVIQIMEVKFSTRKLFLTSKRNAIKNYSNYLQLLDEYYTEGKKLSFNENIKLNFRNKLAGGNFDANHFNYCINYEGQKFKRLMELQNAQILLKKRSQTHRVNKFAIKQNAIYFQRSINFSNLNQKNHQQAQITQNEARKNSESKEIQPQKSPFWKIYNTKANLEENAKKSVSPKRYNSPLKNQSQLKKQSQNERLKLKQYFNVNKSKYLDSKVQKKFKEQFKDLQSKNDFVDFNFNHNHERRLMKKILTQYFIYFKDKSEVQINKIFRAIKATTKLLNMENQKEQTGLQNSQYTVKQFKIKSQQQLKLKSNCLNELQKEEIQESLSWEQFKNLRTTIMCMQPKQVLMTFVAKYLDFNEYGELNKDQLFTQIEIILGQKSQKSTNQIISEVIWSWFQANSIIQNGFIRRITLESWYEKYKIVYFMLSSLIFGTNHKTALDLAYEILV